LGGRAAELVIFGPSEVTQGAAGDLELVSRICREMVTRYGFSSLGPVALESDGAEVFLGRDWIRSEAHYSARTGTLIDAQVRSLAVQALDRALGWLRPRRALIDLLVDQLIQEETIDGDSFRQLVDGWEKSNPHLVASGEANVEAAQVGV
jgi:cell division protease FtsH